jgi:hypothetical protein
LLVPPLDRFGRRLRPAPRDRRRYLLLVAVDTADEAFKLWFRTDWPVARFWESFNPDKSGFTHQFE